MNRLYQRRPSLCPALEVAAKASLAADQVGLDVGPEGILVPRCNTTAEARALVDWTDDRSQGKRTFCALGRPIMRWADMTQTGDFIRQDSLAFI